MEEPLLKKYLCIYPSWQRGGGSRGVNCCNASVVL